MPLEVVVRRCAGLRRIDRIYRPEQPARSHPSGPVGPRGKPDPTVRGVFLVKSLAQDPREEFLARINFSDTRVRAYRGFLFLCGGEHSPDYEPLLSARHVLYHELVSGRHSDLASRLKVAEDIQDWFRDGKYGDLVTFEEHLAGLSSVILLIVESPGSIAELGAFAVTPAISGRLIALIDEQHFEADSFIRLGPINRLESETARKVSVHDWHDVDAMGRRSPAYAKLQPHLASILEDVRKLLREQDREQVYRSSEPGHTMILICELCDLFGALSHQEIARYMSFVDSAISSARIDQYLFLLEKCDILRIKAKGQGRYYYAPDWVSHITFSFRDSRRVDRDRLRVDVFEYYERSLKSRADVVRHLRKAAA